MKNATETALRLKKVLLQDKLKVNCAFMEVLETDVVCLLENYFELANNKIDVLLDLEEEGNFSLKIVARCERVKNMGVIKE